MAGGLLMPADAVCYPPCVAKFLVDRAIAAGGSLIREPVSLTDPRGTAGAREPEPPRPNSSPASRLRRAKDTSPSPTAIPASSATS